MISTKGLAATSVVAALLLVAAPMVSSPTARVSVAGANTQRFCTPARVIADQVARPVLGVTPQEASVLSVTLARTAKNAPKKVSRAMRNLASVYKAVAGAGTATDRAKVAFARAVKFEAGQKVFAAYYASHCVQTPVSAPNLPGVGAANQAACLSDLRTLELAETTYSTLNSGFGTMDQLVAAQLIAAPSAMHPSIVVGTPAGGYTVVGNHVCNDTPVAG